MSAAAVQKVLIVEDDPGVARLQQRALERAGFPTALASTAEEARTLIEQAAIELIVLDYRLTEQRTGLDFYSELKAAGHDLPVILVTGFSQESTVIHALREGVRDFVTKSADYLEYLPEAVHRVLRQVETEKRLSESEARFQSFMDNSPTVAFTKEEDGRYVYANQLFERLFARTDWMDRFDVDLWPKDIAANLRKNDLNVLASGHGSEVIEEMPLAGGELRHWVCYRFPIQDLHGRRFVGCMAVDITERRKAEQLLKASEAKFRSVSESAIDAIIAIDAFGKVVSWNGGASTVFGYSPNEVLGQSVELLMPERFRAGHRAGLERARSTGELRLLGKPVELAGWRKDGTEFPFEVCLGSWQSDGERYFSGIIRDITARKETEQALRQREEELRQSQKMQAIGTLAGGVAHEFNNLLQAILGYTRFAMEGLDEADARCQDLKQVLVAGDRASSLTRQLLGFGRRQTLARTTVDPNQIVAELVKMLRPLISSNIELAVELADDVCPVYADAGQLQQVLLNLCLNARDAMQSGGQLSIKTKMVMIRHRREPHVADENQVAILVSDTGCGMSPEVKQRIFEPFFTTKGVGKGTGLGMAVAYSIVQQHGGDLQVDSRPGQGSTFTICLPVAQQQIRQPQTTAMPPVTRGSELILVAEDEPVVNSMAVRVLQNAGYRTLSAANGEEALRLFEENRDEIALAIIDLMMPKMDGYEVCRAIQALHPGTPVCLCSGHFPEKLVESFAAPDVELIQKPFEPAVLLASIRRVLDKHRTAAPPAARTKRSPFVATDTACEFAPFPTMEAL